MITPFSSQCEYLGEQAVDGGESLKQALCSLFILIHKEWCKARKWGCWLLNLYFTFTFHLRELSRDVDMEMRDTSERTFRKKLQTFIKLYVIVHGRRDNEASREEDSRSGVG